MDLLPYLIYFVCLYNRLSVDLAVRVVYGKLYLELNINLKGGILGKRKRTKPKRKRAKRLERDALTGRFVPTGTDAKKPARTVTEPRK